MEFQWNHAMADDVFFFLPDVSYSQVDPHRE